MMYNPKTKSFEISQSDLELISMELTYAMRGIRELAGLPMDKYQNTPNTGLTAADHAQKGIIDAAKHIGIDMGGDWGNQIDLRRDDD